MPERKCQTCKHYEPSPIRRMGWCRNPLLYSPQQSHLVEQTDLDCGRGLGNYWEPIEPLMRSDPQGLQGDGERLSTRSFRLFVRQPQLATAAAAAGGGVMASSTSGGSGGGPPSGQRPTGASGSGSGQPPRGGSSGGAGGLSSSGGPPRPGRSGGLPPGQERIVSYQREDERYWTDYLRVALPIVGLLLLFGLLWFWLSSIIGDDNNDKPTATATAAVALITQPAPTATAVAVAGITPTVQTNPPTQVAGEPTTPPEQTATEAPAQAGTFKKGDLVVTTDSVRLRSDPSTASDDNILESLEKGTELQIASSTSKDADGYTWWKVTDTASDVTGWVVEDFIEAG